MTIFKKIEDTGDWQALLDRAPFKTFFHTLEWENFLEKEFSWMKFERYIWKDELLLSVARCRMLGKEKIVSHPFCEYGGPLLLKEGVDCEGFVGDFKKEFGSGARMKLHPYISQYNRGLTPIILDSDSAISTFWIEDFSKKSQEDLWNSFRKTLKQEIKKGQGFAEVGECQSESELRQFYSIYLRTVRRHRNIPLPFSVFDMLNGHAQGHAKIFLAKKDGQVVGGSIFLFYPPFIHYFISASNERFRDQNIGHQMLWHVMQKYVGGRTPHIYDYFDLGGTRKGSALEVFKRGWGAKEYNIPEIGARSGEANLGWRRSAWALMPTIFTKKLAPYALYWKI